jgi:type IV pilus assembly protein PilA
MRGLRVFSLFFRNNVFDGFFRGISPNIYNIHHTKKRNIIMNTQNKKGFTLVEIMIVVVIIGLLAAMAIPAFQKVRETAVGKAMTNDARQLASAAQQYMLEESQTAVTFTVTGGVVSSPLSEYVRSIGKNTAGPGTITLDATFSLSNPQFNGNTAQVYSAEGQP